jgi:uncharacterized protein (DUF1810 family)
MDDPFSLQRFVEAQDRVMDRVYAELRWGQKLSHWMWYVFPQITGLGSSVMAHRFAIASLAEATAYMAHPVLGERLRNCTSLVCAIEDRSIGEVFGQPDDMKFHASVTLFERVTPNGVPFRLALNKYFGGHPHSLTLKRLKELAPH